MQTRGYDGFSYSDIAERVGIRAPTIHYHFPTKADLATAIAADYRAEFADQVGALTGSCIEQLRAYASLFTATLVDGNCICLGGMLAREPASLPEATRSEVRRFFIEQLEWLSDVLADGIAEASLRADLDPQAFASAFLGALEGTMLVAQATDDSQHVQRVADQLIAVIAAPGN